MSGGKMHGMLINRPDHHHMACGVNAQTILDFFWGIISLIAHKTN